MFEVDPAIWPVVSLLMGLPNPVPESNKGMRFSHHSGNTRHTRHLIPEMAQRQAEASRG